MEDRKKLLQYLVSYPDDFKEKLKSLTLFSWDSEETMIELTNENVEQVLTKFLSGMISSEEVEEWANFIEGRDDINYFSCKDIINKLANPILFGGINRDSVTAIISFCRSKT